MKLGLKQKDVAMLLVVIFFASVFSVMASKFFFTSDGKKLEAQVVQPITTEFQTPDSRVFNDKAINPTQLIQIGNSNNKQPF